MEEATRIYRINRMMLGCMLCLETSDEVQDDESIKVNSEKWHELKVENLIEQHLWHFVRTAISFLLTC